MGSPLCRVVRCDSRVHGEHSRVEESRERRLKEIAQSSESMPCLAPVTACKPWNREDFQGRLRCQPTFCPRTSHQSPLSIYLWLILRWVLSTGRSPCATGLQNRLKSVRWFARGLAGGASVQTYSSAPVAGHLYCVSFLHSYQRPRRPV